MRLFAACLLLLACAHSPAQVKLPSLISDGMVLQRNTSLTIWGWAAAGEKVTISFNKHTYTAVTGGTGKWTMPLPEMKAGGPYTMIVSASNSITIKDILVGDVWFCSGQSNMVLNMERVKEKYP
ncbi:MAG TPA: sialate O-acetylesterase, partial [Sediminibacterium sp.]